MSSAEFGIPAGHWRQIVYRGSYRKVNYFDALWRPVLTREYDYANPTTTAATMRYTARAFDHEGRETFTSYPVATATSVAAITKGVRTDYDALGRLTRVAQDNELGSAPLVTKTEYLGGFQTRVTNPRLQRTVTRYMAFDQPTTEWPIAVTHPEGAYTYIYRDVFGKPTWLVRRNGSASDFVGRRYFYDGYQRLCRVMEPETGSTVMEYDNADNLAWSVSGLDLPATTACYRSQAIASAQQIKRSYDQRNRLRTLTFPDGLGNQTLGYWPDGLPKTITADNAGQIVTTSYNYNKRRMLENENMAWGSISWNIGYDYNGNGHLAAQHYPDGLTVSYAPNALGQPTQAGSYANGVSYHPNGAIAQFTYGNGIVHQMSPNARGLPERSVDAYGSQEVIDDYYDYDHNGNVAAISDGLPGAPGDRTMAYDGLDRLVRVTAPILGGYSNFGYDTLDNLVSGRMSNAGNVTYGFDANNRLTNVRNSAGATIAGLGYDARGNMTNKNGTLFDFDAGNRLRSVTGGGTASSYVYDGRGRRVRDFTGGSKYSLYSQPGQLMYASDLRKGVRSNYIHLGGSLVAVREYDAAAGKISTKYQHTDALGSPIAVTNEARTVIERNQYAAYGAVLNQSAQDGPGYTGHVQDAATGLTYMQQRYYDPGLGRFLSVDPVTANSSTGGNFNRYKYANNNPYKFTDPDGRLSYITMIRDQKVPIHIDDNLPTSAQAELKGNLDAGIGKINGANLSGTQSRIIQNIKAIDVDSGVSRSKVDEPSGKMTFEPKELADASPAYAGSMIAHDANHVEQYNVAFGFTGDPNEVFNTRTLQGEQQALSFQLGVGEKLGMSGIDKAYLQNFVSNPKLLQPRMNQEP